MKKILLILLIVITSKIDVYSQQKNFIDQPFLETVATVDTLVQPDRIFLDILISEDDTRNRESVEELENRMALKLQSLGIDIKEQLILSDLASNFKKYFLKQKDVLKSKSYELKLYDALKAGQVLVGLEEIGISNVELNRTEYSKIEKLKLELKSKAIIKAKKQADALVQPMNQTISGILFVSDKNYQNFNDFGELQEVVITGYGGKRKESQEPIDIDFKKIKVISEVEVKFKIQ